MCVRTRTSYGCGHRFKNTNECNARDCPGVEKYHYMKEGDCRDCKKGGETVSRGRDGQGRYAQKIQKSKAREQHEVFARQKASSAYDVSGGAGPWAEQVQQGKKTWESPHRKQADVAWLSEHDDRLSDLQERLAKIKVSKGTLESNQSRDMIVASKNDNYDDYDSGNEELVQVTPTKKYSRPDTARRIEHRGERLRSSRRQDRQDSYDSLPDSMPSYRSSPISKIKKTSSAIRVATSYPESANDYDYYRSSGQDTPKSQHRRLHHVPSRARTDPHYSRKSHGHDLHSELSSSPLPLSIPPPAVYETYEYYSPNASPSGVVPYACAEYPYDVNYPSPRSYNYVGYRRY